MFDHITKLFKTDAPEAAAVSEALDELNQAHIVPALDTTELCGQDKGRGFNMTTASGMPFWPADPRAEDVRIEDAVKHLSRITRFNGALKDGVYRAHNGFTDREVEFFDSEHEAKQAGKRGGIWVPFEIYTVAQHCALVCDYVGEAHLKLPALLHDLSEAYLGDMIKPIKNLHPGRKKLEHKIDCAVAERFGFDVALFSHPSIKEADYRAVLTEHRDLQNDLGLVDWGLDTAKAEPWDKRIIPVLPSEARRMFMERFNKYYKGA